MFAVRHVIAIGAVALTGVLPLASTDRLDASPALAGGDAVAAQSRSDRIGGTACRKVGQARTTSVGSFRCTKVGRALRWRRVAVIPTTTTTVALHTDPTISGAESLQELSVCQIRDATNDGGGSSGFPRPSSLRSGLGRVEVLVIPVGFADLPFTARDAQVQRDAYSATTRYFEAMTYGRASVNMTLAPESAWVVLDGTLEQNGLVNTPPQYDASGFFRRVVEIYSQSASADGYDVVSVVSAYSERLGLGQGLSSGSTIYGTYRNFSGMLLLGRTARSWEVITHELGHAWLGFEDLYVFGGGFPLQRWDLMSSSGSELSGWSRFLAGWMDASWIRCVNPGDRSRHFLAPLNSDAQIDRPRVLVVPLNSHTALVADLRTPGDWAEVDRPTVVLYRVDTSINHGRGPIRLVGIMGREGVSIESDSLRFTAVALAPNGVIVEVAGTT